MERNPTPTLSALKRIDDHEAFARLKPRLQARITTRIEWAIKIEEAEHGEKGKIIAIAARDLKVSPISVSRFAKAFQKRGWQALLDERGKSKNPLPEAFKDFVRQLHFQCQRETTGREAHRMLIERWRLWRKKGDAKYAIPGYDTPPPAGPKGYPHGWSDDNVLRLRPDRYTLAVARQGSKRAAGFLPSILKTRVGMKFGQVVMMDDQWYDVRLVAPGLSQKVIRPHGFNILDFYSGCFLSHSVRFRIWDTDAQRNRELSQQDYVWSVINYLQTHGYRRDSHGTTLVGSMARQRDSTSEAFQRSAGYHNFDEALLGVTGGHPR